MKIDPQIGRKAALASFGQGLLSAAAVAFFWTALPARMEWRYDLAAHKVIAIDAGHVCQIFTWPARPWARAAAAVAATTRTPATKCSASTAARNLRFIWRRRGKRAEISPVCIFTGHYTTKSHPSPFRPFQGGGIPGRNRHLRRVTSIESPARSAVLFLFLRRSVSYRWVWERSPSPRRCALGLSGPRRTGALAPKT